VGSTRLVRLLAEEGHGNEESSQLSLYILPFENSFDLSRNDFNFNPTESVGHWQVHGLVNLVVKHISLGLVLVNGFPDVVGLPPIDFFGFQYVGFALYSNEYFLVEGYVIQFFQVDFNHSV